MLGSIIGDIAGSIYEFDNIKTKQFPLFAQGASYTDDSILTVATADWLLHGGAAARYYCDYAVRHLSPMGGYGSGFSAWIIRASRQGDYSPYNSCGNGSAMRVGPVGWAYDDEEKVMEAARQSAICTHNHPEGIKGAEATALCILMARRGHTKNDIRHAVEERFGYNLSLSVDELRPRYSWNGLDNAGDGATCQGSVPEAIRCVLDATDFEDAVRNAISLGGDSDTIGCITGAIAEALFGIPHTLADKARALLPEDLKTVVDAFEAKYPGHIVPDGVANAAAGRP